MTYQGTIFPVIEENMLIGGASIGVGARIEICNPARPAEIVGTVVRAAAAQAEEAIAVSKTAQASWGAKTFVARAAALDQAIARLDDALLHEAGVVCPAIGGPIVNGRRRISVDFA